MEVENIIDNDNPLDIEMDDGEDDDLETALKLLQLNDEMENDEDAIDFEGVWSENIYPINIKEFTGPAPGPTFSVPDNELHSPIFYADKFVPQRAINLLYTQTNLYYTQCESKKYAEQAVNENDEGPSKRQRTWYPTTSNEMILFLCILLINALHPYPEYSYYWGSSAFFSMGCIKAMMSLNRFQQILRYFHCSDNSKSNNENDLYAKVRPFLDILVPLWKKNYNVHCEISGDEQYIKFHGACQITNIVRRKPHIKLGIRIDTVSDGRTAYIYAVHLPKEKTGLKIEEVMFNLLDGLENKNHWFFCDNLYTSTRFFNKLLVNGIYATGTCRTNKWRGFPTEIDQKKVSGKLAQSVKGTLHLRQFYVNNSPTNLLAVSYYDTVPVRFMTTGHTNCCRTDREQAFKRGKSLQFIKRINVQDSYNKFMGGVDRGDQMRQYYHLKIKSVKWWISVVLWALDVSFVNAYICYKDAVRKATPPEAKPQYMTRIQWFTKLIEQYIARANKNLTSPRRIQRIRRQSNANNTVASAMVDSTNQTAGQHWPTIIGTDKNGRNKQLRCRYCYTNADVKNKKKTTRRTAYKCKQCDQPLCVYPCFEKHIIEMQNKKNNDFSILE